MRIRRHSPLPGASCPAASCSQTPSASAASANISRAAPRASYLKSKSSALGRQTKGSTSVILRARIQQVPGCRSDAAHAEKTKLVFIFPGCGAIPESFIALFPSPPRRTPRSLPGMARRQPACGWAGVRNLRLQINHRPCETLAALQL